MSPQSHGRFTVVPAAYVFLLRAGDDPAGVPEVLLQLRRNTGYMDDHWAAAAAGHVERGETAVSAAHREAAEELGVADLALEFVTTGRPVGFVPRGRLRGLRLVATDIDWSAGTGAEEIGRASCRERV